MAFQFTHQQGFLHLFNHLCFLCRLYLCSLNIYYYRLSDILGLYLHWEVLNISAYYQEPTVYGTLTFSFQNSRPKFQKNILLQRKKYIYKTSSSIYTKSRFHTNPSFHHVCLVSVTSF